ncbi:aldehyde dehydrogenase family protein, partial [Klebsiella pneumoniae]|nr:aldehyde dehydrogenase family protein [Klebsiella pneumoniae]
IITAGPIVGGKLLTAATAVAVTSPTDSSVVVGKVHPAGKAEIDEAAALAKAAAPEWDVAGGPARARVLRRTADMLEADMDRLVALL